MKLIHTADIHLDQSYAGACLPPGFGNQRRNALREVFAGIMQRAAAWPADAVLIAGDLFNHDRVNRDTLQFIRDQFDALRPIPVFIAPGNADPFVASSPYVTELWPANVFIFKTAQWTAYELRHLPLTVHGFGFDGQEISSNPFPKLKVPLDNRVHVALAHGSEETILPAGKHPVAPFRATQLAAKDLQYLALGHYHDAMPVKGAPCIAHYSGAPEGLGFDDIGIKHYLEVQISEDKTRGTSVRAVPSSQSVYLRHQLDCAALGSMENIEDALRALPRDPQFKYLLELTLTGPCVSSVRNDIQHLADMLSQEFDAIEIVDRTQSEEDFQELALENTSLGAFIAKLNDEIKDAPDPQRREMLLRAREIGLAGYRNRPLRLRGIDRTSA